MTDDPHAARTVEVAQTLWGGAVRQDAAPTLSIKVGATMGYSVALSRIHPGARRLDRQGGQAGVENDFALVGVLGTGGMGIVYAARQASLDREIAIKMLQASEQSDAEAAGKFLTEAVVTGDLDHPNIVPVYDMGRAPDGSLFYAMKEVKGTSWDKAIRQKSLDENLRILLAVCDAMAYAHDKGVMHRDLKPDNVMLGDYGEVLVMDWGLAASLGGGKAADLTHDSGLAGTPAYMSPEMARCDLSKIGRASEIYLLGGILYEILTGLRPHTGKNVYDCIAAAMDNRIQPSPKRGELIDTALKAMATDPSHRHRSVKEFQAAIRLCQSHAESARLSDAADERRAGLPSVAVENAYREATEIIAGYQQALRLWDSNAAAAYGLRKTRELLIEMALRRGDLSLARSELTALETESDALIVDAQGLKPLDELIVAVKSAMAEAVRRERLVRFSVAVAVVAAVAALGLMAVAQRIATRERDRAQAAERAAVADRDRASRAEGEEAARRHEIQTTLRLVEDENYFNVIALAQRSILESETREASARLWATPRELRGWEWGLLLFECRRDLLCMEGHTDALLSVDCSPDGERIVSAGFDGRVVVWNAATGEAIVSIKTDAAAVLAAAFASDGQGIVVATRDGQLRNWDATAKREVSVVALQDFSRDVSALAFTAGGARAAGLGGGRVVQVWDARSGQSLARVALERGFRADFAAVSCDGRRVLAGSNESLAIYDAASGALLRRLLLTGHAAPVLSAAFSPDGKRIVTASRDRTARIWDAETGQERLALRGHGDAVSCAVYAPNGQRVVTGSHDHSVRIWDAECGAEFMRLAGHAGAVTWAAFSPDGSRLITTGEDGLGRVWDVETGKTVALLKGHAGAVTCGALPADGTQVLTGGTDGTVRLWDAASGRELAAMGRPGDRVSAVAFAPDGLTAAVATPSGVELWNTQTRRPLASLGGNAGGVLCLAYAHNGRELCVAGRGVSLWDTQTTKQIGTLDSQADAVAAVAFSPDDRLLVSGGRNAVRVWDVAQHREIRSMLHGSGVSCVGFSADGRRIVTGALGFAKVWDTASGRELLALPGHAGWVNGAAFSPDGSTVVTGGEDGTLRLWLALPASSTPESVAENRRETYARWLKAHAPDRKAAP